MDSEHLSVPNFSRWVGCAVFILEWEDNKNESLMLVVNWNKLQLQDEAKIIGSTHYELVRNKDVNFRAINNNVPFRMRH